MDTTSDAEFDALVPRTLRHLSAVHWTPVAVAARAVAWLAPEPGMRVLDVGCGVGKLCVIGALQTRASWFGVEQHRTAVLAAIELSRALGVSDRTHFIHGDVLSLDWSSFDALYFYNPFEILRLGGEPDERARQHDELMTAVQARLASLPPGVRVVTYHGLGGALPAGYASVRREHIELGDLELWIQGGAR